MSSLLKLRDWLHFCYRSSSSSRIDPFLSEVLVWIWITWIHVLPFHFRKAQNDISVKNLHEDGIGTIPNPVRTFEEAFIHYRKENLHGMLILMRFILYFPEIYDGISRQQKSLMCIVLTVTIISVNCCFVNWGTFLGKYIFYSL